MAVLQRTAYWVYGDIMEVLTARVDALESTLKDHGDKLDTIMGRTERFEELDDTIRTLGKVAAGIHRIAKWFAPIIAVVAAVAGLWATLRGVK